MSVGYDRICHLFLHTFSLSCCHLHHTNQTRWSRQRLSRHLHRAKASHVPHKCKETCTVYGGLTTQLIAPNSTSPSIRSAATLYSGAALMQCEHHGAYLHEAGNYLVVPAHDISDGVMRTTEVWQLLRAAGREPATIMARLREIRGVNCRVHVDKPVQCLPA